MEAVKEAAVSSLIAAVITMFAWLSLFGWTVAATIYKDHQDLVSYIPKVKQKQSADDQKVMDAQKQEIDRLKKQIPKLNPQCWMQSIPLRVPRNPETAKSESEAVIVCNVELRAPRTMVLYYDQSPIGYGFPIVLPERTGQWGDTIIQDKSLMTVLTAGFVGAYQAFVVVVDGGSVTPPVATKIGFK